MKSKICFVLIVVLAISLSSCKSICIGTGFGFHIVTGYKKLPYEYVDTVKYRNSKDSIFRAIEKMTGFTVDFELANKEGHHKFRYKYFKPYMTHKDYKYLKKKTKKGRIKCLHIPELL